MNRRRYERGQVGIVGESDKISERLQYHDYMLERRRAGPYMYKRIAKIGHVKQFQIEKGKDLVNGQTAG